MKIGILFKFILGFACHYNSVQGTSQRLSGVEQDILSSLKDNFEKLDSSNVSYNINESELEWKLNEDEYKKLRSSLKGVFHDARLGMHLGIWYLQSNNITIPKEFTLITSFNNNNETIRTKFNYVDKPIILNFNRQFYVNVNFESTSFQIGTQLGKRIPEIFEDYLKRILGLINSPHWGEDYHKGQILSILNRKDDQRNATLLEYIFVRLRYQMFDVSKIDYNKIISTATNKPMTKADNNLYINVSCGDQDTDPKINHSNGFLSHKYDSAESYRQQGSTGFSFGVCPEKKRYYICVAKKSSLSLQV